MLKYSLNLKKQLKRKRELDYVAPTPQEVRFDQTTVELQEILKNADIQIDHLMVEVRKKLLQHLLTGMSNLDDLKESLKAIFEREQIAMRGELTASHYVFQTDLVKAWIWKLLTALDNKAMEWMNAKVSANFSLSPYGYKPSTNLTVVKLPVLEGHIH